MSTLFESPCILSYYSYFSHQGMLKCWSYNPDQRPTFKYCLSVVEELYLEYLRNPVTGAHEDQYISTVPGKNPQNFHIWACFTEKME